MISGSDRLCEEFERLNSLCYTNDNNALAESLNLINSLLEKSEGKDINETVEEQEEEEPLLDMWHILTIQLTLVSYFKYCDLKQKFKAE
ncbi:unnamed protein product [Dracunculus medinensis]|uniref:Uncharacterized protein n=1 Tax=Dracunculus medinensis TaxID=318479 RepID=A0A0N4UIV8_DRAME|nr:unnamed protein product [Dracunculus medinensis]